MFTGGAQSRSGLGAQLNGASRRVTWALALVWLSAPALGACDTAGHKVNAAAGAGQGTDGPRGALFLADASKLAPCAAGALGVFSGTSAGQPPDPAALSGEPPDEVRRVDFTGQTVWATPAPAGLSVTRLVPAPTDSAGPTGGALGVASTAVTRWDNTGHAVWTWTAPEIPVGDTGTSQAVDLTSAVAAGGETGASGWVVVGTVGFPYETSLGSYVARLDDQGTLLWDTQVGGENAEGLCAAVAADGAVFLGGTSDYAPSAEAVFPDGSPIPPGTAFKGGYLAALDGGSGAVRWALSFGNPDAPETGPWKVTALVPDATTPGTVFAGGSTYETEMFVAHLGPEGQQDWFNTYQVHSGVSMSYLEAMAPAPDGGLMMAGWGHGEDTDASAGPPWAHVAQVARIDHDGTLQFLKTYSYLSYGGGGGVDGDMEAYRIVPQGDGFLVSGDFFARGAAMDGGAGEVSGAFLMLTDGAGEVL